MVVKTKPTPVFDMLNHLEVRLEAESPVAHADTGMTRAEFDRIRKTDICDWMEANYWLPPEPPEYEGKLIVLRLYQKGVLRVMFTRRDDGHFPFQNMVWSQPKKQGKSTISGGIGQYLAETQVRYGDIMYIGNDLEQAQGRGFRFVRESLELTPGFDHKRDALPGRWELLKKSYRCTATNSTIKAIAMDAKGEAGGRPYCSFWTELHGFESKEARRFWVEMTPVPTVPDSMRAVETYAGFSGESQLLWELYDRGMTRGRQMTNHEFATIAARDKPGERYKDFLHAFKELEGDPKALVPIWIDGRFCMFWDSGDIAHRTMDDHVAEAEYYAEEQKSLPPNEYDRIHRNLWTSSSSSFLPLPLWDACYDPDLPVLDHLTPIVVGVDAAVTGDCFGIVAVSRHPTRPEDPAVRAKRLWIPPPDGEIDFDEPEAFLRWLCQGGCKMGHPPPSLSFNPEKLQAQRAECRSCRDGEVVPKYKVVQIAYDAYQLAGMMQRIRRETDTWCKAFQQNQDRLVADRDLYVNIVKGRFAHNEDPAGADTPLRDHIKNADMKLQKEQDSKMRIIKRAAHLKVDLVVATSMASYRCLKLVMENA